MATSQGGYVDGGFDLLKAPDAPTITSVTTSIGSMSVAFTAPANPGGSAVTGYTVTAINESTGASVGATGSASPISVSTGGGTFKVRSAAANIYGPGRVSAFNTGNVVFSGAELYSWGSNTGGIVGDGTVVSRSSPVQIGSLTNWRQVSPGLTATASTKLDGTLWSWGANSLGQLGQNNVIYRSSPVQVGALTNWTQVSSGATSMGAVKTDGTLWTWGFNSSGQLGDGTVERRSSPVQIGALTNWSQVSVGSNFTAAVKTDSTLWVWGSSYRGQLAQNSGVYRSSPIQVGALSNWARVATNGGADRVAAIKTDGTLWTWGQNSSGSIGDNVAPTTIASRSSPVQVGALTNWSIVATGGQSMAAIKTDGTMWTWGRGDFGSIGDNAAISRSSPVQVGALTDWSSVCVASTIGSVAATKTNGTLWAWGYNVQGQLGQNNVINRSSPVQIGSLTAWVTASSSGPSMAALYGVT